MPAVNGNRFHRPLQICTLGQPSGLARGACVGQKGSVVGIPPVNGNRRRAKEPGEERQLLEMVSETVRHRDTGSISAAQRITDLKVALAACHLSRMSPERRRIDGERVVHPFTDLMGSSSRIREGGSEEPGGVEIKRRVSLCRSGKAGEAMIADKAAGTEVGYG